MRARAFALAAALAIAAAPVVATAADPPAASAPKRASQGVAVIGTGEARDAAFELARAVYGSPLRPRELDELRARILGGDPAPPSATKETRDLAELRASIRGDDAASRRLLAAIGEQLHVQAILVVGRGQAVDDAGTDGATEAVRPVVARLFLVEIGEYDAARYEPEGTDWRGTVASISARFPAPPPPPPLARATTPAKLPAEPGEKKPFYLSPWLWGAVGAALLLGGLFFFASRDNGDDPIQLRMRVPR